MASVVTVPSKSSRSPAAVLLTKQDFEQLRNHALSPSKDLPRCIPISAPLLFGEGPDVGALGRGNSLSAAAGKNKDRVWPEKAAPPRRSRSASGRRPPQLPPRPHSDPLDLDAAAAAAAAAVSSLAGACGKSQHVAPVPSVLGAVRPMHALKAQNVASRVRKERMSVADSGSVDKQRGQTPPRRQPSRQPPAAASRSNSRGISITTVGCGSPHGGHSAPPPAATAVSPSRPSVTPSRGSIDMGISGFGPRRLPRPTDMPPARVAELPLSSPPGQAPAIIRMGMDNQSKLSVFASNNTGLSVSGQAAAFCIQAVSSETPTTDGGVSDLKVEDWTSSEEEGGAGEESDTAPFYYRDYRYQRNQVNQEPPQRGRSSVDGPRRRARRVFAQPRDESSDSGYSSPWSDHGELSPRWRDLDAAMTCGTSRSSTPCCEEEGADDELCRVAEALVKFYGLPGGMERAVRLKYNAVIVNNEAWARRHRESNLEVAPTIWVRGGRTYDFHGDRGTIDEFEHDLLGRQVEDDSVCRGRRREQGLMPFPFVAVPIPRREEDPDEREDDTCAGAGAAGSGGGGRRRHWL
mmetsp:Transcript_110786/g.213382  ORF Transcript_110786/g.213382 Transcript_110786/m.213382 type:complete len:576 (-) Transcript_110786:139-1866(-)